MILQLFNEVTRGPWKKAGLVEYRIVRNGIQSALYFKATGDSVKLWENNLDFPAVVYKRSPKPWFAHGGYVKAWKESQAEIMDQVYDCESLLIGGFSRGSAFALFAHEDYTYKTENIACTTTFGGPRVLWMSHHIAGRFVGFNRVVNRGDPVAMVPPAILGYHHVGRRELVGKGFFPDIKKHEPASYIESLKGL